MSFSSGKNYVATAKGIVISRDQSRRKRMKTGYEDTKSVLK